MANKRNDFPVPGIPVGPRDRSIIRTSDFWRRAHTLVEDRYIRIFNWLIAVNEVSVRFCGDANFAWQRVLFGLGKVRDLYTK